MHSRRTIRWKAADNIASAIIGAATAMLALWAFVEYVSHMPVT